MAGVEGDARRLDVALVLLHPLTECDHRHGEVAPQVGQFIVQARGGVVRKIVRVTRPSRSKPFLPAPWVAYRAMFVRPSSQAGVLLHVGPRNPHQRMVEPTRGPTRLTGES